MAETHDDLRELAGVYALGALSAAERERFETHLEACDECRAEVRSLQPVVEALASAVPYREPSADLRERVLTAALSETGPPRTSAAAERPPVASQPARAWPVWLATAASVAALVLGGYSLQLRSALERMEARLRSAEARAAAAEADTAQVRQAAAHAQSALSVLAAPDLARVDLAGQPAAREARGRAFWSRSRGLVFTAANLPPPPAGRTYQLWVVTPQAPVNAGLLTPDADGSVTVIVPTPPDLPQPVAIAVTLEPEGGVPAPTGEKYLIGTVAAAGA
jgi:anti-sigma-K factor RskA